MSGPTLTLEPITAANIDAVLLLTFTPEQQGFVSTPAKAIAQAYVHRDWIPVAICADGIPVGYAQYVIGAHDGRNWLLRLLIDGPSQGKGYGRRGLELVLDRMRDLGAGSIHLSCDHRNKAALRLYERLGFVPNGEVIEKWDEIVLVQQREASST